MGIIHSDLYDWYSVNNWDKYDEKFRNIFLAKLYLSHDGGITYVCLPKYWSVQSRAVLHKKLLQYGSIVDEHDFVDMWEKDLPEPSKETIDSLDDTVKQS